MVPEGWRKTRLADAAKTYSGGTPSRHKPEYFGGDIPWVKSGEVNAGRVRSTEETISESGLEASSAKWVPTGAVLLAMYGATAGRVALLQIDATINQAILAVLGQPEHTTSGFLLYALEGATPELLKRVQGSGQPNLSAALVKSMELRLPPLPEQRKIAAILTAVDETIEKTEAVIAQLGVVKKAMMQELLTRGLPGRHTRFKKTEIGEVPEEWEVVGFEQVGRAGQKVVRSGPFGSSMKTKDFRDSGVPVFTIQSLGEGSLLREGLFYVDDPKAEELDEYRVIAGDIIFSRVADIGRSIAIENAEAGWLISPNLMRIRLDPNKANARFVMYALTLGGPVRRQVVQLTGNSGRPVVSSKMLLTLRVPLPPLDEQEAIAGAGANVEKCLDRERAFLAALSGAKAALMSVLLTGELRVSLQDVESGP